MTKPNEPLTDQDVVAPLPEPEGEAGGGEPSARTISFGGKQFEVSAEIAQLWEAREDTYKRGISGQGAELGQLRQEFADLKARVAPPTPPEPEKQEFDWPKYEALKYEDPSAADKMFVDHLKGTEDRLRREYRLDQAHREVRASWRARLDQFYSDNPDLSKEEDLVDLTYQNLLRTDAEFANLVKQGKFDDIFEKVADGTRRRILRYSGGKGEPPRPTSRGGRLAMAEGGGGPVGGSRRKGGDEEDDGTPQTMADAIRAKQRKHKGAHQSRPPGQRDYRPKPSE